MSLPTPTAFARLVCFAPAFVALASLPSTSFAAVIAGSNFNLTDVNASDANDNPYRIPNVTWAPAAAVVTGGTGSAYISSGGGTIDVQANVGGTISAGTPSGSLRLYADFTGGGSNRSAELRTPILAVSNTVGSDFLNLSFDLWANRARPITVRIEFFATATATTPLGYREATIRPPVFNSYYRYSLDVGQMSQVNNTNATSPFVRFTFILTGANTWPASADNIIAVDNLLYASPSKYVAPGATGNGLTAATPGDLVAAINAAAPGDVIMMRQGGGGQTYPGFNFHKAGRPYAWITLRAYPGETPIVRKTDWSVISLNANSRYLDLRGLTVRGYADTTTLAAATTDYNATSASGPFNCDGIYINGSEFGYLNPSPVGQGAHHIRIADNVVTQNTAGGISAQKTDYLYVENNVSSENCHYGRYGSSGFSTLNAWNFDGSTAHKTFYIANTSYRNRGDIKWKDRPQGADYSDGNGIIIDNNLDSANGGLPSYTGRTLVQNNLCYANGGSGIHANASWRVDIVNNTAYENAQPNEATGTSVGYAQIFGGYDSQDVNIINNVLWARSGLRINSVGTNATGIYYAYNVYGGNGSNPAPVPGNAAGTNVGNITTTLTASAVFVAPYDGVPNFKLKPFAGLSDGSSTATGVPRDDRDGNARPLGTGVDRGAFENL